MISYFAKMFIISVLFFYGFFAISYYKYIRLIKKNEYLLFFFEPRGGFEPPLRNMYLVHQLHYSDKWGDSELLRTHERLVLSWYSDSPFKVTLSLPTVRDVGYPTVFALLFFIQPQATSTSHPWFEHGMLFVFFVAKVRLELTTRSHVTNLGGWGGHPFTLYSVLF